MADTEEPRFNTLAERIAALNKQKSFNPNGNAPAEAPRKKPPPPPPPGPKRTATSASISSTTTNAPASPAVPPRPSRPAGRPPLPQRESHVSNDDAPPLPSRTSTSSTMASPALPPRRPSAQSSYLNARRNSASSEVSQLSTASASSLNKTASSTTSYESNVGPRKLPPPLNKASLPPLPPTRRELEAKAQQEAAEQEASRRTSVTSSQPEPTSNQPPLPSRPKLPPRTPSRPVNGTEAAQSTSKEPVPAWPAPQPSSQQPRYANIRGFGGGAQASKPPPLPGNRPQEAAPPPVPTASRPSVAQIEAANTRSTSVNGQAGSDCWICRDWSGPDNVAAQFPRQSLPRQDVVGYLARGLCDPFPSYSDKARAIFTWFHHNIFYDTEAFFGNNVKHQTVEDTIFGGWAVCQGYADTYKAIAERAGLDCVVVGGHGKGFGHTALKKGERPPPPKPDGHAWNAVRVDGGKWKLLDACWGAGHICGANNLYKQEFSPKEFISPNDKFGWRHFPQNPQYQFRDDGRTLSWDEYFIGRVDGETPQFYGNGHKEGIAEDSVSPAERQIPVYGGSVVRFQFSKLCEHWTSEKNGEGKPPLFLLSIHGVDGRKDENIPIETDGYWHWVDVNARDLGAPGQSVQVLQLTTLNGQDARGISAQEYLSKKGKTAMSWAYVIKWDLV